MLFFFVSPEANAFDMLREGMCIATANDISSIVYLRDEGVKRKRLIRLAKENTEMSDKKRAAVLYDIDEIYDNPKVTQDEVYDIIYALCINPKVDI